MLSETQWQTAQNREGAASWRLINSGFQSAAHNMATDEAIMQAYAAKLVPPTIRFYGWQPAAVSIGYFQHGEREINFAACQEQGIDVVRRLTGGRAVLHAKELTYSIIVGEDYPDMPMTITASYRYLSRGLLLGLAKLGLTAEMTKPQAAYAHKIPQPASAACFDAPSHYELTVSQKKLIGSAQVRKHGVILQHGSILLDFSSEQLAGILQVDSEEKEQTCSMLKNRVMDLKTALGRNVAWDEARLAMEAGFAEALGIELAVGGLTALEKETAGELSVTKYAQDAWTLKR